VHQNAELINSFYGAFQRADHRAMNACYGRSIRFSDPVFRDLEGDQVRAMWHMFCESGSDVVIGYSDVSADDRTGKAHWEATYSLSGSDRVIHNVIEAEFVFRDGSIYRHRDSFDLWKWTRMALGTSGTLLGWSGPVKNRVRGTAMRQLNKFMEGHPEYS
jgi:hypothetical protein